MGGVHALSGVVLLTTGIGLLADTAPDSAPGWFAVILGCGLMAAMVVTGLRLGLGEPMPAPRAALMIVATLAAGLTGAAFVLLTVGR